MSFGGVNELKDDFEVVVKAPGAVFFIGEYSVLHGQAAIVMPIPLFTYVAIRLERDKATRSLTGDIPREGATYKTLKSMTALRTLRFLDQRTRDDFKVAVGEFIDHNSKHGPRGFTIKVRSQLPTRCGLNSSGALSAALSVGLHILTNRIFAHEVRQWRDKPLNDLVNDADFMAVFKFAVYLESKIHGKSSGCGPFASLVGASDQFPIVYSVPSVYNQSVKLVPAHVAEHVKAFRLSQVIQKEKQKDVRRRIWRSFAVAFSGQSRPIETGAQVSKAEEIENRLNEGVRELHEVLARTRIPKPQLPAPLNEIEGTSTKFGSQRLWDTFGSLSLSLLKNLIDADMTDVKHIVEVTEGLLMYLRVTNEPIDFISRAMNNHGIACKITGSGGGGDLVLFSDFEVDDIGHGLKQVIKSEDLRLSIQLPAWELGEEERSVPPVSVVSEGRIVRTIEEDWKKPLPRSVTVTLLPVKMEHSRDAVMRAMRGENDDRIVRGIAKSMVKGPQVIVLPELCVSERICPDIQGVLRKQRDGSRKVVVGGSYYKEIGEGFKFNRCPIITSEAIYTQDKVLRSPKEETSVVEGSTLEIFRNTPVGNFVVSICSSLVKTKEILKSGQGNPPIDFVFVPSLNRDLGRFQRESLQLMDIHTHVVIVNSSELGGSYLLAPFRGQKKWAVLGRGETGPKNVKIDLEEFRRSLIGRESAIYKTPVEHA